MAGEIEGMTVVPEKMFCVTGYDANDVFDKADKRNTCLNKSYVSSSDLELSSLEEERLNPTPAKVMKIWKMWGQRLSSTPVELDSKKRHTGPIRKKLLKFRTNRLERRIRAADDQSKGMEPKVSTNLETECVKELFISSGDKLKDCSKGKVKNQKQPCQAQAQDPFSKRLKDEDDSFGSFLSHVHEDNMKDFLNFCGRVIKSESEKQQRRYSMLDRISPIKPVCDDYASTIQLANRKEKIPTKCDLYLSKIPILSKPGKITRRLGFKRKCKVY